MTAISSAPAGGATLCPDLESFPVDSLPAGADVGALPVYTARLDWESTGGEAEQAFLEDGVLPGILVMRADGRPWLLCRSRFMEVMTHPYAHELYVRWPLSRLPPEAWAEPLVVETGLSIAEAASRALARPPGQIYDPLVTRDGAGGMAVLDMPVLLQAEGKVLARYAESLEVTLNQLQKTQDNLVEARKMAALAGLVAGIAHEINTPVGLALTSASFLKEQTQDLIKKIKAGNIKRSELDNYLAIAEEAGGHLEVNLERAAELIRSFKQVAIDQTSQERRVFALGPYIEAVVFSLRPQLKKLPHRVIVDCPPDITMDSYPGALSQVLSNLILNALVHAFSPDRPGTIGINARATDLRLSLSVTDDGSGISPENLPRIFDPFFTTKRGEGGSGLGLNIVYNLATRTLGGSIACTSQPGTGTRFDLSLPLKGPSA